MRAIGIIPSRYASTRLCGKPLIDICGKKMIEWVYEGAKNAKKLSEVYIATDSEEIKNCALGFGAKVCMTSESLRNGTQRVWRAYKDSIEAEIGAVDVIVNIQGDEPLIQGDVIDDLVGAFECGGGAAAGSENACVCAGLAGAAEAAGGAGGVGGTAAGSVGSVQTEIATMAREIDIEAEVFDPNVVKVVKDRMGNALYFSRAAIPFNRNAALAKPKYFKHIGLYAYRADVLGKLIDLQGSPLEQIESLEQLSWLENGYKIKVLETKYESLSVDVAEDIEKIKKYINR